MGGASSNGNGRLVWHGFPHQSNLIETESLDLSK
jgi:hypothetical protein